MKEESTVYGVNPEQLRHLFNIGGDTKESNGELDDNQLKAEMLCRTLSQILPIHKSQMDMLPSTLNQLYHSMDLLVGETITELLNNPSTDISFIEGIKRYGKDLSAQVNSKTEHEVATAIYYAAIAHALVYHSERITRFSYEELKTSFARLVKEKWIPRDLSSLFKAAGKYCKGKV